LHEFFVTKAATDLSWFDRAYDNPVNFRKTRRMFAKSEAAIYSNGKPEKAHSCIIPNTEWMYDTNLTAQAIKERIAQLKTIA
jgi:hypothetical protein